MEKAYPLCGWVFYWYKITDKRHVGLIVHDDEI